MSKSKLFGSAVAALAVSIGVASVAWASSQHGATRTIHLIESAGQHSARFGGPPSIGDSDAFNAPLADPSGQPAGHSGGQCTVISTADGTGEADCLVALSLPAGQIVISGLQPLSHSAFTTAVVGGTGEYKDARGEVQVTPRPNRTRDLTVHLD